jgi:TetR/AcrR family transcriptional regulator, transcriptional repressor for nem operon
MDLAENHMRNAGYGGFSFRDLAAEIGIKSASVHHHFPTKATMAAAVARRYADRFFATVARSSDVTADEAIAAYRSAFKAALDRDGMMCLFGVLGAEAGGLSPEVANEILTFFRRCIEDLSQRIGGPDAEARAFQVIATLEGGTDPPAPAGQVIPLHPGQAETVEFDELERLSMAETCARLTALKVPHERLSDFHLKIGCINHYPTTGVTMLDGKKKFRQTGFEFLLTVLREPHVLRSVATPTPPSRPTTEATPAGTRSIRLDP